MNVIVNNVPIVPEEWRDIPDYEGLYQASSLGRVKSVERYSRGNRRYKIEETILSQVFGRGNYLFVSLNKNGSRKTLFVHKIIAMTFLGHKRCGYKEIVNHIDFNITNNCINNLELVSARKSSLHKRKKGNGKSKFAGVCVTSSGKYSAHVTQNGKKKYIGAFENEIDAKNAYEEFAKIIDNGDEPDFSKYKQTSKYGVGVYKTRNGRYTSKVTVNGNTTYLPVCDTAEEAVKKRNEFIENLEIPHRNSQSRRKKM